MGWTYTALTEKSEAKLIEITTDDGSLVFVNGTSSSSKTLSVVAEGFTPVSYKWEKKNGDNWTTISSATNSSYTITGVENVGTYRATAYEDANTGYYDIITIASVSDGQGGSSPYLFSVSNENFSISTDNSLKPTSALNYDITITGYHGSALMTPVAPSATLASGQYKVACSSNLFTLQNDNKTLRFTTDTATALASANQSFTVTVSYYNDSTSSVQTEEKIITVSASKNGVDGVSPTATVSRSGSTTTITITDKSGTTSETVSDGANGVDSYSCNASTDAIIIATDTSLKPLSATATNVVFKCFKGTTALTAVASSSTTVGANQFRVTTPSNITGITFAQSTNGTLTVTPSISTAIGANTSVSITVAIGSTSNTVTKTLRIVAAKQGNASTVPGPSGQRAIRYLGKSATTPNSNNQTSAPSGISTPIVGDWYLCTANGNVYYCTAISSNTYTWSVITWTNTSTVPDYRLVACLEDMIVLSQTITNNTTMNNLIGKYINSLVAGTALINKLFSKEITLQSGGWIKSDNYIKDEAGIILKPEGIAEFNGGSISFDKIKIYSTSGYVIPGDSDNKKNMFIGEDAGAINGTGHFNTGIGRSSLRSIDSGNNNTCIGSNAGDGLTSGSHNILIGYNAGSSLTTEDENVVLSDTATVFRGSNNVLIGSFDASEVGIDINHEVHINNAIKYKSGALYINTNTYFQQQANWAEVLTASDSSANSLINSLTTGDSVPTDNDYVITQYVNGGTTTTTYHRRKISKIWDYIKGKISSILGLTATDYGGTSITAKKMKVATSFSTSATTYVKVSGMLTTNTEHVFTLQSREGELLLISTGYGDGATIKAPKILRLCNQYSKILGCRLSGSYLIFKIAAWSHVDIISQIVGDSTQTISYTTTTETEYNRGTEVRIKEEDIADKIRTSAPSSPENGDIWIE